MSKTKRKRDSAKCKARVTMEALKNEKKGMYEFLWTVKVGG
ncbi:MAG: hypothetical protein ACE5FU_00795 [Nitrospinota bacterium]